MVEHYDVAVIGAGPSGAAAALHSVRRGFETVLIDSAEFPRDKTCGDGLTPRGLHQLNQLGVEVNSSYRNKGLKLHGFGTSATAPWPSTYPCVEGTALQRHRLDALLVDASVAAGAHLLTGAPATDPLLEGNRLVEFSVGEKKIRAKEVIVADGVRSTFGQKLGRIWHKGEVFGIAARSYCESPFSEEPWMHSHVELRDEDGVVQPGYGWIFPIGDGSVNLGCGALSTNKRPAKVNTKKLLSQYASQQRAEWQLGDEKFITSAALPMGGAVSNVAGANWMIIGDAAACVNPLNGEGIDYGLETAALATEILGTNKDLTLVWPDLLRQHYGEAFMLARTLARVLTYPQFLPLAGPIGLRGPMHVAARLMGNLITDEDRDFTARLWRTAGTAVSTARAGSPLWDSTF